MTSSVIPIAKQFGLWETSGWHNQSQSQCSRSNSLAGTSFIVAFEATEQIADDSNGGEMSHTRIAGESRRSARVVMKLVIVAKGLSEPMTCDGETIVVNRHGALIASSTPLRVGMKIEIHVILTDKRAPATVVYVDPDRPRVCGIGLAVPYNIWGLAFPPDDWYEERRKS